MTDRWPQAGDICQGSVLLTRSAVVPTFAGPTTVCFGLVSADDGDWAAVPADWPYNPLVFSFWSAEAFEVGESVIFDISAGPFAPYAADVSSTTSIEDLAAIAIRMARKNGKHEDGAMLQGMLEDLYQ